MFAEHRSSALTSAPRGALLVRLCNWVGEAVLSLPALRRLAEAGYELHLYGKCWAPALFEGAGWPVTVRCSGLKNAISQLHGLRPRLDRGGNPVPALLMTNSFSSALEMRLAGFAPSGYAAEIRGPFLHHAYRSRVFPHAAHAYWHLSGRFLSAVEPFPAALGWTPSAAQQARAQELLARHGLAPHSFVVLCPFSGADDRENRKVWPGFQQLAKALAAAGVAAVICPGPGEEAAALAWGTEAICVTGVDLGVYGALFQAARCVAANDTGPGHLAAAAGARLIGIYGPNSRPAWTPIGHAVRLFHDAPGWPGVDEVTAAVLEAS